MLWPGHCRAYLSAAAVEAGGIIADFLGNTQFLFDIIRSTLTCFSFFFVVHSCSIIKKIPVSAYSNVRRKAWLKWSYLQSIHTQLVQAISGQLCLEQYDCH